MPYRLRFDRRFRRHLNALPGDVRGIARKVIQQLAQAPRPGRASPDPPPRIGSHATPNH